jgi:hypothetical protein
MVNIVLTPNDIEVMKSDVRGIIRGWNTRVDIYVPDSVDNQKNWNEYLKEYTGDIGYTLWKNVVAERKDQTDMSIYKMEIEPGAGLKNDNAMLFTMSDLYPFVDNNFAKLIYEGSIYRVERIKHRIGEVIWYVVEDDGTTRQFGDPTLVIDGEIMDLEKTSCR